MLRVAFRNLFQSKVHFAMSVGGVALALTLILSLGAIYTGAERQLTTYIDNSGADVWVAQSGVKNLHMVSSWMSPSVTNEAEGVPGVESATPIMYLTGFIEGGKEQNGAYVFGLPEDPKVGKPWRIAEGVAVPDKGEAIIDSSVAERLGKGIGERVEILGRNLKIVGLSEGTTNITSSVAFISMHDFKQVRGGSQAISFVLAQAEPGESPAKVARRIESDLGGVSAQSTEEFAEQERALVMDMAGDVLAIMNVAGFTIGLAVVALTIYTATLSRRAEYGVLKAIGARNRHLYGVVMAQALLSVALGFVVGLVLTMLLSVGVPALIPSLELRINVASLLKVGALSLVIAALAAVAPVRQIAGLDPAAVFRGK